VMEYKGPELTVRLRETGAKRHILLGSDCLVNRKVHAVRFLFDPDAVDAIRWMFENNPGHFDSGQVVKGDRVVATVIPGEWIGGTRIEWA
jgi:predicted NAD/FAD-dependent oxidoreductase